MTATPPAGLPLSGRIALVTGASRGFGAAVAVALARAGAHLVLVARTVGGLEAVDDAIQAAGGERPTLVPLDLQETDKVDALGPALFERFGRLDILVSNAATLGTLSPVAHSDLRDWKEALAVNVRANVHLIRTLDPLLRGAPAGRAVFVTCGQPVSPAFWGIHAGTRAFLETVVQSYAAEVAVSRLRVNLFDPGPMRTRMRVTAFPGEDPNCLPLPEAAVPALLPLVMPDCVRHGERVVAQTGA